MLAEAMSLLPDTKNDHVLNYTPSFMQPNRVFLRSNPNPTNLETYETNQANNRINLPGARLHDQHCTGTAHELVGQSRLRNT